MDRVSKRIEHVFIACAIFVLALGCGSSETKPSPDMGGSPGYIPGDLPDPPPVVPPGDGSTGSEDEDFVYIYGGSVTQQDLPLPLVDDPDMPAPNVLPDETPTAVQLDPLTSPWPAKSQSEIQALLEREQNAQPTAAQRAAMAQLGQIAAPESP